MNGIDIIDAILKFGSLSGLFLLFWVIGRDINNWRKKPKLRILPLDKQRDLRNFLFATTGWERRFATIHVKNNGLVTAERSVAVAKFIKTPKNIRHLEREYALHWADIPYTLRTTGAEPVDIGQEPRRLDVAFTHKGQRLNGCWITMPIALSGALQQNQAYLPPGEYEIEIKVSCEQDKKGDTKRYKIISPKNWIDLDMDEIKIK